MVNGVQRVVKLIPASCGNYRVTQIYMTNVYKKYRSVLKLNTQVKIISKLLIIEKCTFTKPFN